MSVQLTSASVWNEIERNNFAVLGMVTAPHQARAVGIVYVVDDHRLYIGTGPDQWKTKHIAVDAGTARRYLTDLDPCFGDGSGRSVV